MKKLAAIAICMVLIFAQFIFGNTGTLKITINNFDTIQVEGGKISGIKSNSGDVFSYKGIPFASPPIGELRWKAPQPVVPWDGVKSCNAFGPSPMQGKPVPFMVYTSEFLIPVQPISEDCLYLNVWTKAKKGERLPVFVWIYGGGFASGGTGVPIYDGEAMANKGIIFVSVNYRVGVFGFMANPELTKESPNHAFGNYGLLDQIAGLNWVKQNIAAFGGDPHNVTVAGQSAGAMSVNCLIASPLAKGLFNKAIAESGSVLLKNGAFNVATLQQAEQQGLKLQEAVHATSLKELRTTSAEELMKYQARYAPIVDGYVLPEPVSQLFAEGKQNNVPVITGWNADDALIGSFLTKDAYLKQANEKYGDKSGEFLKYFPANTDAELKRSQINLSRDMTFAVSGYKWAVEQSEAGKAPVYIYNFNHRLPATPDYEKYGAFHTGEVAYVTDNLKFLNRPFKPEDYKLAADMSGYWINFIKYGNPNGAGLPNWPKFTSKADEVMIFNNTPKAEPLPDKGALVFILNQLDK